MKTMTHLKLWLFAGILAVVAAGCGQKENKSAPSLEGRWTGYDITQPGTKCTLTITSSQIDYRGGNSNDWCRLSFVKNDQVQPPQMDVTFLESPAHELVGKTALGIYGLEGDRLSVAVSEPGSNERPVSLTGGPHVRVFSFRRE